MEVNAARNLTPERWQQIKGIFEAAVELDPSEQDAFLERVCSGDEALRLRVKSLLSSDEQEWELLEKPAFEAAAGLFAEDHPALSVGQCLGHYKILDLLGTGGMGEVYLAEDARLSRNIALKLLPDDFTTDELRMRQFQREARAASALNHPNILTIHESGEVDGRQFIATEFVDGETLRQRLKRAPLTLPETLDIAIQVAGALSAAHQSGIVHRDVKPENVMLRRDGYVKVLDFGLAKLTGQHERMPAGGSFENADHSSGLLLGTMKYMSPEQAGGITVDARSDIFSVGVLLYEMVAGQTPFRGETPSALIAAILNESPPPPANAPHELQSIIVKALRKDIEERYQTSEELLISLRSLKEACDLESRLQRSEQLALIQGRVAQSHRPEENPKAAITARGVEYLISELQQHKLGASLTLATLVIAVVGMGLAASKLFKSGAIGSPFQKKMVTRLTTSGHATKPAISPDGKYVLYGSQEDAKVSLWLRQIGTHSELQILPLTEGTFGGATFSPDGKDVYYCISVPPLPPYEFAVYRLSTSGGNGTRLPIDVHQPLSVSPDGKHLAYVRGAPNLQESSVRTASADGTDERVIIKRERPYDIGHASWSPKGESIAYARFTESGNARIFEVNVANATETPISQQEWRSISGLVWLSDMSGLIVVAPDEALGSSQIWHLPYPTGEARRLTNDISSYHGVSVSSDGNTMVTEQSEQQSRIWTVPVDPNHPLVLDMSRARQLSVNRFDGSHGLSFTPTGQIVYSSEEGGRFSIWIMDADGGNPRHLYDNGGDPVASPDGKYIVFTSLTGEPHIWRMDLDGGNLTRLTTGRGENAPSFYPDSKWVVYNSYESGQPTVWKVSIEGGAPVQITSTQSDTPWVSPDGKLIAYGYFAEKDEPRISLIPSEGGQPIKTLVIPGSYLTLEWTPDGKALTFLVRGRNGPGNIWAQPIEGGPPRQLTSFTTDRLVNNTWSRDGKQLAFVRATQVSDVVLLSNLQ